MSIYQIRPNNLAVGRNEDEIMARALGSGIVVCLYDEENKAGGMVYTLFPDSGTDMKFLPDERLKYVDSALERLTDEVVKAGAEREKLWAKVVGGAQIFRFSDGREQENIGRQNVVAARAWLKEHQIPIKTEDTGNNFGRTVRFQIEDGKVEIELVNKHKYNI